MTRDITGGGADGETDVSPPTRIERETPAPAAEADPTRMVYSSSSSFSNVDVGEDDELIRPGTRVRHYEILRELGRGGMARVYLARDTKLGRRVALKFISAPSDALTQRFVAEARATAQCNHENIVVIHEVDIFQHMPYMVLEYLPGKPLRELISRRGIPAARAIDYIIPVVRALVRAHESGIVHRDLKPDNVLVTTTGQVKVLDFGIAKALAEEGFVPSPGTTPQRSGVFARELTIDGDMVGTPSYMSPEQFGAGEVDHRTDIWAVGIMLYRFISGQHPAGTTKDFGELGKRVRSSTPFPSLAEAAQRLPGGLASIVDRCLAKNKIDRWESAQALLDALEPLLSSAQGRRLGEDENPFPGLKTFQEDDADRFFGRSTEITDAIAKLRDTPVLAVVGPSGVGKSSFVRAGVVPTLKALGESWNSLVIRPGRKPMRVLAGLLAELGDSRPAEELEEELLREPGRLGSTIRARAREHSCRSIVFVDQFEELYTLGADEAERAAFIACLGGVADDAQSRIRLVVSMRTDLLDRVTEHRHFADSLMRGLLLLATPSEEGLGEALSEPLKMVGYSFEDSAIVEDMLAGLSGASGALPLLQFVASTLWTARDKERKLLTRAAYEDLGGIAGALAGHADHVLRALSEQAQRVVRAMFNRLVTADRTRAIADRSELIELAKDPHEGRRLVDYLVGERLLMIQGAEGGGRPTVEIVHESLITSWPTLRRWLDENEDNAAFIAQVKAAAKQWADRGRPDGLLWTGDAARDAVQWKDDNALARTEREFLGSVVHLATRAVRRKRLRALGGIIVLSVVAVGAVIAAILVGQAERQAAKQATMAVQEANRARVAEASAKTAESAAKRAEAQARSAQGEVEKQLALLQQKEAERAAAVEQADVASQEVAMSKEELKAANSKLQGALVRARDESSRAKQLTVAANKANTRLQRMLDQERQRVKLLEKQKKKIINKLR